MNLADETVIADNTYIKSYIAFHTTLSCGYGVNNNSFFGVELPFFINKFSCPLSFFLTHVRAQITMRKIWNRLCIDCIIYMPTNFVATHYMKLT